MIVEISIDLRIARDCLRSGQNQSKIQKLYIFYFDFRNSAELTFDYKVKSRDQIKLQLKLGNTLQCWGNSKNSRDFA